MSKRDFCLARLAVARVALRSALDTLDVCVEGFVDPSEDPTGEDRSNGIDEAQMALQDAAVALQGAAEAIADMDPEEMLESEDSEEEGGDDPDDDDGEPKPIEEAA